MDRRWLLIWLTVAAGLGAPGTYGQVQAAPRNPHLNAEDELSPAQIERAQEPDRPVPATPSAKKPAPKRSQEPPRVVACNGPFAKDSDHEKVEEVFKPENVDFTDVDAGGGRTIKASVLFPSDPKRRIEVWWQDQVAGSGTYLIVIGGQSTWTGPKGVRLGLPIAGLEKLNGKPFKLKGFDADGVATVSDWQKGVFDRLPGDCGLRVSFQPDPKAPAAARTALANDLQEFASSDAVVRATRSTVSEILIGY
jgi:hypothetical protein